jgi:acyl-[acyl-carrier-protein]-phospholipid O-acyltransferase/long-chain-fatty-acid--[acyl-carrier-protein] ligase
MLKRGFLSLLVAQFFGAANDNILKQVLIFMVSTGLWVGAFGEGGEGYIGLFLTVPFVLLSGFAGQFADRHSKQRIIVLVKIAEVPIAIIALVGLWTGSLGVTLTAFALLAIQSTFFGPAKYGVIPELVDDGELSRANGVLNMLTNIAIIVGTLIAGPVCDAYFPNVDDAAASDGADPGRVLWLPGAVLVGVAVTGLAASLLMPRLRPQDPGLSYHWNPFSTYVTAVAEMARSPLLMVALAWAFFYLIGMIAILIIPSYSDILGIDYSRTSYLLGMLSISIGVGSVTAGLVSGHHVEPRLIPIGAVGMTVFFILLGAITPSYWVVAGLLCGTGFFAGFYIVPLQALLQKLSPGSERGRFLGTANAISFVMITIGSLIFTFARRTLGLEPNRVFLVCGGLALVGTGVLIWRIRRLIADPAVRGRAPA